MNLTLASFIESSIHYLDWNTTKLEKVFQTLDASEIWHRPNSSSNSVGNLVLHLCGNITQYIISTLGDAPDLRDRDAEFAAEEGMTKAELWEQLTATIESAKQVIAGLDEAKLIQTQVVQGQTYTGIKIVLHVVEHYSYHTGQLIFWTKLLKDIDMGYYADWALNEHHQK